MKNAVDDALQTQKNKMKNKKRKRNIINEIPQKH